MSVCIYCKKDRSEIKYEEHVIPEALGCKKTLPKGYVCDSCNNYFSDLDSNLLLNRYIALTVGTEEIPGKKDKIRRHIGENLSFTYKGSFVMKLGTSTIRPGTTQATFHPKQPAGFDESKFARAIYKTAFNCYAGRFGQSNALHSRFDKLRQYIRAPQRDEFWRYAAKISPDAESSLLALFDGHEGEIVTLRLLRLDFLVILTGWKKEIEDRLQNSEIYIVRGEGQWDHNSLVGLRHVAEGS